MGSGLQLLILVGLLAIISYVMGRQRAYAVSDGSVRNLRSLPSHYGTYALVLTAAPALVLMLGWSIVEPAIIDRMMIAELPPQLQGTPEAQLGLLLNDVEIQGQVVVECCVGRGDQPKTPLFRPIPGPSA